MNQQREAFEAFKKKRNPKYHSTDDSVGDRLDWELWQAAQAAQAAQPVEPVGVPLEALEPIGEVERSPDGQYFHFESDPSQHDRDPSNAAIGYSLVPVYVSPPNHLAAMRKALDILWTIAEHNALHFGETHNTVIQGRTAIAKLRAIVGGA